MLNLPILPLDNFKVFLYKILKSRGRNFEKKEVKERYWSEQRNIKFFMFILPMFIAVTKFLSHFYNSIMYHYPSRGTVINVF